MAQDCNHVDYIYIDMQLGEQQVPSQESSSSAYHKNKSIDDDTGRKVFLINFMLRS